MPFKNSNRVHPNGQKKIKISEVKAVYGKAITVPAWCYRSMVPNAINASLVSPAQVDRAAERFDMEQVQQAPKKTAKTRFREDYSDRSILDDIDTAFGLIPQGGALEYSGFGSD